ARLKDLELVDRVEFLGWRDDVHQLMVHADVLVLPSKDEGVPNAVQEAMYIGVPVLVSDAGGMPEIVENHVTGWVLPTGDATAWARQLRACANEPETRERIGRRASAYAEEHFGVAAWGDRY